MSEVATPTETETNLQNAPSNAAAQSVSIALKNATFAAQIWYSSAAASESSAAVPALILLHGQNGIDEIVAEQAQRLAALGYLVLTPDLFAAGGGLKDNSGESALQDSLLALSDSRLIGGTVACLDWLAARAEVDREKLGVIGFDWGGALALMAAGHDRRFRVALNIGGTLTYSVLTANRPGSPLNFVADLDGALFAAFAGQDQNFPAIEIERLKTRLMEHDKRGEVKIYDAPAHFWHDDANPNTLALWRRIESFLQSELREADDDLPISDEGYPNEEARIQA